MPFTNIKAEDDFMDYLVAEAETTAIRQTIARTPGVKSVHDIRTRKMGDLIVADAHIEVDAMLTVEARRRVMQRHGVLNLMTHVDPWKRPDLDHGAVAATRGTATSEVAKVVGGLT